MKSLSPNAQEFVPFKTINSSSNVPLVQINNELNQQQIIHGYLPPQSTQQQFISYPNYEQQQQQQPAPTVYAFNNINDFNNYMLKQQQQQPPPVQPQQHIRFIQPPPPPPHTVHSVSPTINHDLIEHHHQPQIPHHHHHPNMQATSIIPINNATPGAYYAFTSQPLPVQTPQPTTSINYLDSNNMITNQFHENSYSKRSFNNNNNNNNIKILNKKANNKIKNVNNNNKNNIEVTNDKEWPCLVPPPSSNENHQKKKLIKSKQVDEEEEEDEENSSEMRSEPTPTLPKTPYLEDETKLKKLIKNVDFIKKTVEQHYNNLNEGKFSFKDAVLAKPAPIVSKQQTTSLKSESNNNQSIIDNKNKKQEDTVPMTVLIDSNNDTEVIKKHRKRTRSKKKQLEKQDTLTDNEQKSFDLKNEDFPDLNNDNSTKEKKLSLSLDLDNINDAKPATTAIKTEKKSVETATTGKKQNKPIIVDFANMISALEKGVGAKKSLIKPRSKNQINTSSSSVKTNDSNKKHATSSTYSKEIRSLTNPLDTCPPEQKRGKEREKPKQKKPSTLKKIILKEREEKRLLREKQLQLVTNNLVDSASPSSLPLVEPQTKNEQETTLVSKNENYETDETDDDDENEDEEEEEEEQQQNENEENDQDETSESSDESDEEEEEETEEETTTDDNNNNSPEIVVTKIENETENTNNTTTTTNNNNNLQTNTSNPMSPISQGSPISIGGYTPTTYTTLSMLATDRTLLSLEKLEEQVKQKIHNKKFREYCNQITNKEIDEVCSFLLHEIVRFQDRLYHKNPAKAKTKRRYVMGIREVTKHLKLQKLKCVILAPNCEKIQSKGGLDDAINQIIQKAMEQNVPFVFALGRKGLGKAVNKLVPISVVGIFDFSGAEEYFRRLVDLANNAKLAYQEIVEEYEKEECENLIAIQTNNLVVANNNNNNNIPLLPTPPTAYMLNPVPPPVQYHHHHYPIPPPLLAPPPIPVAVPVPSHHIIQLATNPHNPIIPSHMGHSRNSSTGSNISIEPFAYHMNYHTHSRSASGNFNFGQTSQQQQQQQQMVQPNHVQAAAAAHHHHGHSRSASGGNTSMLMNIDFGMGMSASAVNKHWTHSRTPSNCSNISFISRLSEPISEVGSCGTLLINNNNSSSTNLNSYNSISNSNLAHPFYISNSNNNLNQINNNTTALAASLAAVQYYTEQVRQEMREQQQQQDSMLIIETEQQQQQQQQAYLNDYENQSIIVKEEIQTSAISSSLVNLHLGCIDEADIESAESAKLNKPENQ